MRYSTYCTINIIRMEDIPAGRRIRTDSQPITPRKANNPIGTQSQWSFGWQGNEPKAMNTANSSKGFGSYHNQSSIHFGDGKEHNWKKEESNLDFKKKPSVDNSKPVWNYNPKLAGKTTMVLGDQKPDYTKKDEFYKQRTPTTLTNSRKKAK